MLVVKNWHYKVYLLPKGTPVVYGKSHLDTNAHVVVASRTIRSMDEIAKDEQLSQHQRLLARQCRDLAASLFRTFKEPRNG